MNNLLIQIQQPTLSSCSLPGIIGREKELILDWDDLTNDEEKNFYDYSFQKRFDDVKPISVLTGISNELLNILIKPHSFIHNSPNISIPIIGSNQIDLLIHKIKQLGIIENYYQMRIYLLKHQKISVQVIDSICRLLNKRFKKERQIIVSIESDYDIQEHMKLNIRIDDYSDSFISDIININKEISSITKNLNAIIIATSDFEEPERYGI